MNLSDSPTGLFQTSRFFSWGLAPHQFGPPVLTASILCSHPLTNTPAALGAAPVARFTPRLRPSSCFNRLGVHIALFEACSVFILIRGCVLADPAALDLLHRRLRAGLLPVRHAPTASGWSNSCRVGYLPPTGSLGPFTAHVESRSGAVAAVAAPFPDPAHQTGRAVLASGFRTRVNELSPTARWCENGLSGLIRASHEDMQPDSGAAR